MVVGFVVVVVVFFSVVVVVISATVVLLVFLSVVVEVLLLSGTASTAVPHSSQNAALLVRPCPQAEQYLSDFSPLHADRYKTILHANSKHTIRFVFHSSKIKKCVQPKVHTPKNVRSLNCYHTNWTYRLALGQAKHTRIEHTFLPK